MPLLTLVSIMHHDIYFGFLTSMFLFWNSVRVLTYIPTIIRLLSAGANVRSHSLLSWLCWSISNGTFALMLLERNNGVPESMFWLNVGNTVMCFVVSVIIVFKQRALHAGKCRRFHHRLSEGQI